MPYFHQVHSLSSSGTTSPSPSPSAGYSTPTSEYCVQFEEPRSLNLFGRNTNYSQYILVVGGLGYIGSHTSLELLRAGFNVVIVDNLDNSHLTMLNRIKVLRDEHYRKSA